MSYSKIWGRKNNPERFNKLTKFWWTNSWLSIDDKTFNPNSYTIIKYEHTYPYTYTNYSIRSNYTICFESNITKPYTNITDL